MPLIRGEYPPLSTYAFLSDTHTAALVGPDGAVEWFCTPRFDGPSVCARILDRRVGGAIEVIVDGAGLPSRSYRGENLVLESRYAAPLGTVDVLDFLALHPPHEDYEEELLPAHLLVRLVRCTMGEADVEVRMDLRPDYGRGDVAWQGGDGTWTLRGPDLVVSGDLPLKQGDGGLHGRAHLEHGDGFVVAVGYAGQLAALDVRAAAGLLDQTERAWQVWAERCRYDGYAADLVRRSALVLRGLAFDESGALVAAPTTSLPEWIGGQRTWDYRYTWHRDASLHVLALFRLGHEREGRRYLDFLLGPDVAGQDELAPMAAVDGSLDITETVLDHLEGYAGSRPVRIGNEAYTQQQWDTYGHVLDAAYVFQQLTGSIGEQRWAVLRRLLDTACAVWREPDHGVWEIRGDRRRYTYSAIMMWVCLDRGIRLAEELDDDLGDVDRWRRERDEIRAAVLKHGYDEGIGAFVQSFGSAVLDAALLQIPLVGFLPGDDPRVVSTIDRIVQRLGEGEALVHRYDPLETEDGIDEPEAAFLLCSFYLVSALVLAGRRDEAERRFRWLCDHAGPLGLLPEEMSGDGTPLGNYPQAFSHLALIEAALNIDAARRDEAGREEALHAWASGHQEQGSGTTRGQAGVREDP